MPDRAPSPKPKDIRFRDLFFGAADPAATMTCAERAGPHRGAFGATGRRARQP
jgi:hypothetical protein